MELRVRRWPADQELSSSHRHLVELLLSQADNVTLAITEMEESLQQVLGKHPAVACFGDSAMMPVGFHAI